MHREKIAARSDAARSRRKRRRKIEKMKAAKYFALVLLLTKTRRIDKYGRTWYAITIDRDGLIPRFFRLVSRHLTRARSSIFVQTISNFMCVPRNAGPRVTLYVGHARRIRSRCWIGPGTCVSYYACVPQG